MKNTWFASSLAFAVVLVAIKPAFADDLTLSLLPASDISGPAGSTIGWGYSITNNTLNWVETDNLNAGIFLNGTPASAFDFPILAPMSVVTEEFSSVATGSCSAPPCGLYELTWDSGAPVGFVNSGTFTVSADYFDGDPNDPSSTDLGPAPDMTADYSATVSSPGSVPEPSALMLLGTIIAALTLYSRRHRA